MAARKRNMAHINTARDAITALGGTKAIAASLQACPSSIGMWVTKGYVSGGHRIQVLHSLQYRGYELDEINPELFGLSAWEGSVLTHLRPAKKTRKKAA